MASESQQKRLERNRKPRVHITMDVEVGGAMRKVELPFIIGVLGDFTGQPEPGSVKPLRERKFVSIDRDNFERVMDSLKPRLQFRVENTITGEGEIPVELTFRSMEDFNPARIAEKIEPVKKLLEKRAKLLEFQNHADRSPELERLAEEVLGDMSKLEKAAGGAGDAGPTDKSPDKKP